MFTTKSKYQPAQHFLDNWLNQMTNPSMHSSPLVKYSKPATNIKETADAYLIELAAPGLSKEDFTLKVEDFQLTISAGRKAKENDEVNVVNREFFYGEFEKHFILPETIKVDDIEATYDAGILRVHLPKTEEAVHKVRDIAVN